MVLIGFEIRGKILHEIDLVVRHTRESVMENSENVDVEMKVKIESVTSEMEYFIGSENVFLRSVLKLHNIFVGLRFLLEASISERFFFWKSNTDLRKGEEK